MAHDTRTSLRLPADLMRRVARVRKVLAEAGPGPNWTDSAVIRAARIRGLDALEDEAKQKRRR